MLRGMDPKPLVLDFCKPQCIYWKEKLERCESKLEIVIKTNPTKTCLYPFRDWATCVEACVSSINIITYTIKSNRFLYFRHNLRYIINSEEQRCHLIRPYEHI